MWLAWAPRELRTHGNGVQSEDLVASLAHRQDPTGAAHLEMVQHLLPRQEQQSLFPDLPGDLRVEEGVLSAAIRHPLGEEEKNRMGDLAQHRARPASGSPCLGPAGSFCFYVILPAQPGCTPLPREATNPGLSMSAVVPDPPRLRCVC